MTYHSLMTTVIFLSITRTALWCQQNEEKQKSHNVVEKMFHAGQMIRTNLFFREPINSHSKKDSLSIADFSFGSDLKRTPLWIWRTEKTTYTKTPLKYWGAAAGAIGLAYIYDDDIYDWVKREKPFKDHINFFDVAGIGLTRFLWAGLYFGGKITEKQKFIRTGRTMIISSFSDFFAGQVIGIIFPRKRPRDASSRHDIKLFNFDDITSGSSFPSGHTSGNFAVATVITFHYGFKYGFPFYIFGGLVGYSRIAKESHYLTDIIGGAFFGTIIGFVATTVLDKERPPTDETKTMILPDIRRGYTGLRFTWQI